MSASTDDSDSAKIEILIKQLGDVNSRIQERATDILANYESPLVLPRVTSLLRDENANKRRNAARILSTIGNVKSVEPLITALSDKNPEVRYWVAGALGMLGDVSAIPKLSMLARSDTSRRVKEMAKKAIEDIKKAQSSDKLRRQIEDKQFQQKAEEVMDRIRKIRARNRNDKPHKKGPRTPRKIPRS